MAPTATPVIDQSDSEAKKRPISPQPVDNEAKKPNHDKPKQKKGKPIKRKYKVKDVDPTSPMGVLQFEVKEILSSQNLTEEQISNDLKTILNEPEVEAIYHRLVENVTIERLSSNGDGLAIIPHPTKPEVKQIALIPFGLPGDVVTIRVFKSHPLYVETDLIKIETPSSHRNDDLINCRYFGKCSGCQFQNVDYDQQLVFKRQTIENAYKYFAPLLSSKDNALPPVTNTEPSPLKYNYRTKLTPHFNLPYKTPKTFDKPSLGFGAKGRPQWRENAAGGPFSILDIEECAIGTEIINQGMKNERDRFDKEYLKYRKGATILLRENTKALKSNEEYNEAKNPGSTDVNGNLSKIEVKINDDNESNRSTNDKLIKTCVTQPRQIVTEYINGFIFEFSAGEFFQNNNSILPIVTNYVKKNLSIPNSQPDEPNYLVDAYCGSGLFSITCSDNVSRVIGVEVSADSVKFAERNAKTNNIQNASFIVGKAEKIFGNIDTPANRTSVILDPPRKGCDDVFLNQLSEYHPAKIVYISCNVHSQARDVDWFINKTANGHKYYVESIKGFDFFPQTHHVESVAVLSLKQ